MLNVLLAAPGSLPARGAESEPGIIIPSLRDSLELAAFMDGLMASTMDDHRAVGAMVSIIQMVICCFSVVMATQILQTA